MFALHILDIPEGFLIDESQLESISLLVSEMVAKPQNGIINIAFLSDTMIQDLNLRYRGIDKTTDVLSFHYFDDFSLCHRDEVGGEIVLSLSKIESQSREHGHSRERELMILILHGLLHILGYDHETDAEYEVMWEIEKHIRSRLPE